MTKHVQPQMKAYFWFLPPAIICINNQAAHMKDHFHIFRRVSLRASWSHSTPQETPPDIVSDRTWNACINSWAHPDGRQGYVSIRGIKYKLHPDKHFLYAGREHFNPLLTTQQFQLQQKVQWHQVGFKWTLLSYSVSMHLYTNFNMTSSLGRQTKRIMHSVNVIVIIIVMLDLLLLLFTCLWQ